MPSINMRINLDQVSLKLAETRAPIARARAAAISKKAVTSIGSRPLRSTRGTRTRSQTVHELLPGTRVMYVFAVDGAEVWFPGNAPHTTASRLATPATPAQRRRLPPHLGAQTSGRGAPRPGALKRVLALGVLVA